MTDRKYIGVSKITVNSVDSTNVIRVEHEYVMNLKPVTMRGTVECVDVNELPKKFHRYTLTFDTQSTVFDSYIDDDGDNPVIPSMSITLDLAGGDTELWTLQAGKSYVESRGERRIEGQVERRPGVVVVICIGTRVVTHP